MHSLGEVPPFFGRRHDFSFGFLVGTNPTERKDEPEVEEVVESNEEISQSQGNEWPVAAKVPLSVSGVTAGRALVLIVAELWELV